MLDFLLQAHISRLMGCWSEAYNWNCRCVSAHVRFQWQVQKIWQSFEKESDFVILMKNNLFFCWISFILSLRRRVGHVGTALYIDSSSLNKLFFQVMFWRFQKKNDGARNRRMKNFFLNAMGACQSRLIFNLNSHTCNDWNIRFRIYQQGNSWLELYKTRILLNNPQIIMQIQNLLIVVGILPCLQYITDDVVERPNWRLRNT